MASVPVTNFDLNHDTDLEQPHLTTSKKRVQQKLEMIKSSKSTTCSLDPLLTEIIKKTSSAHIPAFTRLINTSFESGIVLANYRSVSNLPFTAKVMEKIAVQRLSEHLTTNGLHEELQSAYKPLHSTETALMFSTILQMQWITTRQHY